MKTFNGQNLLTNVPSNLEMKTGTMQRRSDADYHRLFVDCTNDFLMIKLGMRAPKVNIDYSVFHQDKAIIKTVSKKTNNLLRDDVVSIIANSKPRFNVIFKPQNQ